jgi:hypothetical protein
MSRMTVVELHKALHDNPDLQAPGLQEVYASAMPVEEARERIMQGTGYAPLETHEQVAVIEWAQWHESKYPCLKLLLHVPNGGRRDAATGAMLKAQGVKAGVPDLLLLCPAGDYHGLAIELKRVNGVPSDVSAEQDWWQRELNFVGWKACTCYGSAAAIAVLEDYCKQVLAYSGE